MELDIYGVKMERGYHHGDLRQALVDTALTVLTEKGVEAFSLRETARRTGVSPAAPKHHFTDTKGLLTALATLAFTRLADALDRADDAAGPDRRARLMAQAQAYAGFALSDPALFDLMWRASLLDLTNPQLQAQKARAFDSLDQLIRGANAPDLALDDPVMAPTFACWSLVHGFARLMLDGGFGPGHDAQAHMAQTMLPAMLDRLDVD